MGKTQKIIAFILLLIGVVALGIVVGAVIPEALKNLIGEGYAKVITALTAVGCGLVGGVLGSLILDSGLSQD